MKRVRSSLLLALLTFAVLFAVWVVPSLAQEAAKPPTVEELKKDLDTTAESLTKVQTDSKVMADTIWVLVTAMLVFFMNLGFACVESGFCRAKNAVNILSKNFIVFAATSLGFWLIGWGLMFGNGTDWFGTSGLFGVSGADNSPATTLPGFAGQLKADVKETLGIDLDDKDQAAANPEVAEAVEGYVKTFDSTTSNKVEKRDEKGSVIKGKDGKPEEVDNTLTVKITAGGKTLEKTYKTADFYWGDYSSIGWTGVPLWAKFFFQLVFAGTAATIVSGAVAERIKYHSFILFSFIMAICIYPVVGHWIWGGGFLSKLGFVDFAGSTQVHSIGGWAALAGILILGPRIGKYGPDGKVNAIPGHNLTAATIGCFVLWFGWFGFNPGSTMGVGDFSAVAEVAVTTNMAAAAATLSATVASWLLLGKPDLGMTLNGCLAGLVAITAPCAFVTVNVAVIIGLIAGVLVVLGVLMFDRLRIDDPVGATSVHLLNGVFGTLCVGLFATSDRIARSGNTSAVAGLFYHPEGSAAQLFAQLAGIASAAIYVFVVALIAWMVLKVAVGIRVSPEEELEGLDLGEHGNEAYHGFVMAAEQAYTGAEPRPAVVPPDSKRFSVVVEGVNNGDLMHAWSELCQPAGGAASSEFKAVYPYVTTVQGNRFRCRGGDPEAVRGSLERLLQSRMKVPSVRVRVDK